MSVREGKRQMIGDSKAVGRKPLRYNEPTNPRSGTFQKTGDAVNMSRKPIASPSANPRSGQFQMVGDKVGMSRKPIKGWGSAANVPTSLRSIAASRDAMSGSKKK